ncbi:trypsin-like peptidase domain-containing protein [Candidatus Saccharibacteria bacterium]|nr:MAG: trypsin-like peptidase domain-containing protein [Candidatus Saccharibacteria bacterium]
MMEKPAKQTYAQRIKRFLVVIGLILIGSTLAIIGGGIYWWMHTNRTPVTSRTTLVADGNLKSTSSEDAMAAIAEKVSPSVVSIITNITTRTIFGMAQAQAAGTGIIVSKDGYILTNKHVISGASKVEIVLSNGTTYSDVRIIGSDPLNDVAFLKVDGVSDLAPAVLGDSSTVRVGQQVVAIGNSLGQYQTTVTSGIISGKGRPVSAASGESGETENLTDLLQTDAAINPGNSGGPLLNFSGQVIGINTAVAADAQGIGFAIPINATKGALKSVLAGKGVQRAYLGLRYVSLTPTVAKQYNIQQTKGALIIGDEATSGVVAGGPADKAGIRDKDVIVKINGLTVGVQGSVSSLAGEYAPGDTIELMLLRGGKEQTIKITLGNYSG